MPPPGHASPFGHFASILCHGIFERYPNTRLAMVEGGLVPFLGFLTAHEFGHYGMARWHGLRPSLP